MDVFLNEKSLTDREDLDIDRIIVFLIENIMVLHTKKIKVYTNFNNIANWINDFEIGFQHKNALYRALGVVEKYEDNIGQFYYHYFKHQDFNLGISVNISDSSIAIAAKRTISGSNSVVMNIPVCTYSLRPFIPILKSSHDTKIKEELANIPCFDSAIKVIQYKLLNERVKPYIADTAKFEVFSKGYNSFVNTFVLGTWNPKTFMPNEIELNPSMAFPASTVDVIKNELSTWEIVNGTYEDNQASYIELGSLVLELHGYLRNHQLSSHYNRHIYEAGYGNNKLLVSIDTENGFFEVIESSGTHLGVYRYDGTFHKHYKNQTDINNHSLDKIPTHMFIFK